MWFRRVLVFTIGALLVCGGCGLSTSRAGANSISDTSAFIEIPTYGQQRNLSCEYAALVIAMGAYDVWVSEWDFDPLVPQSDNPHWGYRGDINGWWGNTDDYGVYPEALVDPLAQFGFRGEVFYAGGDTTQLQRYLANGVPVVVWIGLWGDESHYEYAEDGTPYKLNAGNHAVVAYGYDDWGIYAADPATGGTTSWAWSDFVWMWDVLDGMSLAVWPLVAAVPAPPADANLADSTVAYAAETDVEDVEVSDDPAVCC
jgi:uncharacterized protein YvpB